jgi:uncharacterized membrane protein
MRPFLPSPRDPLVELIEQGALPADKIPAALHLTHTYPDTRHWHHFIDQLLLWLGGLALAFALMFFVAYNWDDLGRFAKFGLVQAFMVLGVAAYWRWHQHPIIGKLALMLTCIGLGVLLALYGQTYQTGADPWQLFFNWALLMLPWALIARFPAIWILWLALINLSCVLYYQTFRGLFGLFFYSDSTVLWVVMLINTSALVCWELLAKKIPWLDEQWAVRVLAIGCGIPATWLALYAIFDNAATVLPGIGWCVFSAALFFYYRTIKVDLFMLAGGCLSGIVVIVAFVAEKILRGGDAGAFLLLALLIIGLSTAAAIWLRNVHKEQQA